MESIFTELAVYGSKNECARTDNVFSPIAEVCDGTVSLRYKNSFLTLSIYFNRKFKKSWGSKII